MTQNATVKSITDHQMILRHFRSTTKVTSNVYKTPNSSTDPMTKANYQAAGKHQSTMNQGQCHARPEDLKKLLPQLIRQTWQFERSLQHQNRPFSQASNACQEEGANRVQRSNRQGTRLSDRRGNHHGAG